MLILRRVRSYEAESESIELRKFYSIQVSLPTEVLGSECLS